MSYDKNLKTGKYQIEAEEAEVEKVKLIIADVLNGGTYSFEAPTRKELERDIEERMRWGELLYVITHYSTGRREVEDYTDIAYSA